MLPPLNVSHQSSTCLILELGLHFKLFDFVEFCKIIFLAVGSKNNLLQNSTQSKSLKSSLHSNPAGGALARHINWWQALFFRSQIWRVKKRHAKYNCYSNFHVWNQGIKQGTKSGKDITRKKLMTASLQVIKSLCAVGKK